jgi:hypothetical protein
VVESRREINGKITDETRFYITSLVMLAAVVGPMIRAHWAIENLASLSHRVIEIHPIPLGAEFDREVFLEALLHLADDFHHRVGDPTVVGADVALLLAVGEQIDNFGQWKLLRGRVHVFLPDKMRFPISPFNRRQPVGDVGR